MHVTDDDQSNDLKALDVVLIKPHMPMVCMREVLYSQCLSYLLPLSWCWLGRLSEGEKGRWTPSAKVSSDRGSCSPGM